MKSAKSCVESLDTLPSRARVPELERDFIETGGLDPGPVCFPLGATSTGGCEFRPVVFDTDIDLLNEEDRERCRVLASSLLPDLWVAPGLSSLIDLLDCGLC